MSEKTHWKRMVNPDYLGAYALEPGKDMILTIASVKKEMITGADGKKEECMVCRFSDHKKPMILNNTNAKSIQKLYNSPYIEDWAGRKIQLYSAQVRAFGETVEALRIRPQVPKQEKIDTTCADCKQKIKEFQGATPEMVAGHTYKKYGKPLCSECASKLSVKNDPLAKKEADNATDKK